MEFTKTNDGFVKYDENGRVIAEITYFPTNNPNVVVADHTFVDPSLRGQGVAGKLLDALVEDMAEQNKKIKPACSYVVKKFGCILNPGHGKNSSPGFQFLYTKRQISNIIKVYKNN